MVMLSLILTFNLHINICEMYSIWTVLGLEYLIFVIELQWPKFKFHIQVFVFLLMEDLWTHKIIIMIFIITNIHFHFYLKVKS